MKVSVMILAYNHAGYIAQAVESVMMQRVNFDMEVLVGEDLSKDGTREVLLGLGQKYPGRIRLLLNEENLGMHRNFARLLDACQGDYIALLEGDDYWTAADKLQKQADFLDQNAGFALCFHNAQKIYADNSQPPVNYCPENQPAVTGFADLLSGNYVPTCSIVFRRELLSELPAWTATLPMLDWSLLALLARQGKIGYLNEVMGVYRVHAGGVWSSLGYLQHLVRSIQFLTALRGGLPAGEPGDALREMVDLHMQEFWQKVSKELYDRVEQVAPVGDAVDRVEQETANFPAGISLPPSVKRKLLAKLYAAHGFRHYQRKEFALTRQCWNQALRNDLSWIKNRGVVSMYLKSLIGAG